jgi:hypothetical protein
MSKAVTYMAACAGVLLPAPVLAQEKRVEASFLAGLDAVGWRDHG